MVVLGRPGRKHVSRETTARERWMNVLLKMMNFALKMMNFVFKMLSFVRQVEDKLTSGRENRLKSRGLS